MDKGYSLKKKHFQLILYFSTISLVQVCGKMNSNLKVEGRLNKTLLMYCYSNNLLETQFSILDYYSGSVSESCLPNIILTACFKVVLIVALWLYNQILDFEFFLYNSAPYVTNFIRSYLRQFFDNSHGLKASLKPLRRPFDRCQLRLEVINNGRDIKQINW